jgi:shikimate dehydrogenase
VTVRHRAAVLGHPVDHSLSPVLHRSAYAALGLADWAYERRDVTEEQLGEVIAGLDETWAGLSLTMPLKQVVIPLLDDVEPLARAVGAVNTVLIQRTGAGRLLIGANTDVHGLVAALREALDGADPAGPAVVLGAGATAASALAALGELGFPRPTVLVRSPGRAGAVVRAAHGMGVEPQIVRWDRGLPDVARAGLLVSTVPAGAADALAAELARAGTDERPDGAVLLDVVYSPWPTPLAAQWAGGGGRVAPGWAMLLHQAAEQVRLMTGRAAPIRAMREALLGALEAGRGD